MRVKEVGTRQAPASVREILSRLMRGHAPAVSVVRRAIPYWQERGWKHEDNIYSGNYQTPHGAFVGHIVEHRGGHIEFFLYSPSDEIRGHSHWTCFQDRGSGWYFVHMGRQPRDVSSGILTIEKLIGEAYRS